MSAPRRIRRLLGLALGLTLLSGCTLVAPEAGAADVDDFEIDSFEADYVLLRDEDGGSRLRTTERITAVFPDIDQNRGIVRSIPATPSAEAIGFEIVEVTDGEGTRRPFEVEQVEGSVDVVVAVPEGEFVHGEQTYVLTYQQRGVISDALEGQEFSWDVNGTGWAQPFGSVSAQVEIVGDLAASVYSVPFCYVSTSGVEIDDCTVRGGDGLYLVEAEDLGAGDSLHLVVQFEAGTFG